MRLPPLNAARVFEAAGRLGSFNRAAGELNITPGAVSKQVRVLEEYLGLPLFERGNRTVKLTEFGEAYLAVIQPALTSIEAASKTASHTAGGPLTIWCSPFFMRLWLVPRLALFRAIAPDLEVVITTHASTDAGHPKGQLGIQRGDGTWKQYRASQLIPVRLVPVCSPGYLAGCARPKTLHDLAGHAILQNLARPDEWPIWTKAAGGDGLPSTAAISFASSDMVYRAALEGAGIALGRVGFIERDLTAGALVLASKIVAETVDGYYLVVPRDRVISPDAARFRRWLTSQIKLEEHAARSASMQNT